MLPRRWLPAEETNAIGTKQSKFRTKPEISVRRLGHRESGADCESVPDGPGGMPVLADIQEWIERLSAGAPRQRRAKRDHEANSLTPPFHDADILAQCFPFSTGLLNSPSAASWYCAYSGALSASPSEILVARIGSCWPRSAGSNLILRSWKERTSIDLSNQLGRILNANAYLPGGLSGT